MAPVGDASHLQRKLDASVGFKQKKERSRGNLIPLPCQQRNAENADSRECVRFGDRLQ